MTFRRSSPCLWLLAAAFLWAPPAAAEGFLENRIPSAQTQSAFMSSDPLMREILIRQVTRKDGGVKSVVRIATGQVIELKVVDLGAQPISGKQNAVMSSLAGLTGLTTHPDLLPQPPQKASDEKAAKAGRQLKILKKQGEDSSWNRKTGATPRPKKSVRRSRRTH